MTVPLIERLEALRERLSSMGPLMLHYVRDVEEVIARERLMCELEKHIGAGGHIGIVHKEKA